MVHMCIVPLVYVIPLRVCSYPRGMVLVVQLESGMGYTLVVWYPTGVPCARVWYPTGYHVLGSPPTYEYHRVW